MADNVAITAGSGTTIGTDERTINSTSVQVQRVNEQGGTAIAADDVSVTSSGTSIAARETRKHIVIRADAANTKDVYVGPSSVDAGTPANGFAVQPGGALTLYTTAQVYLDTASGTQVIYYIETYDS